MLRRFLKNPDDSAAAGYVVHAGPTLIDLVELWNTRIEIAGLPAQLEGVPEFYIQTQPKLKNTGCAARW